MSGIAVEAVFRRQDWVVLAALVLLTLLAWLALLAGAGTGMDPFAMSGLLPLTQPPAPASAWTLTYGLVAFFMWWAMMVAMMLPSASPIVLLYARVVHRAEDQGARPRGACRHRGVRLGLSRHLESFQPVSGRPSMGL
jgi:predicted metal-binding membrane protein